MAAVTICSDFRAPKNSLTLFPLFPHLFPVRLWDRMPWSYFSECWALSQLFHSALSLSSRGFLVPLHFLPRRVVSSAYLRWLIFLPAILIPACASSSPVSNLTMWCFNFIMMFCWNILNYLFLYIYYVYNESIHNFQTTYCKCIHTYVFTQCSKNAVSVQKHLYNSKGKF